MPRSARLSLRPRECRADFSDRRRERGVCGLELLTVADVAERVEQPGIPHDALDGRLRRLARARRQMADVRLERHRQIFRMECRHPHRGEIALADQIADLSVAKLE